MIDDNVDQDVGVLVEQDTEGSEGSQGRLKTPIYNPRPALVPRMDPASMPTLRQGLKTLGQTMSLQ